MNSTPADPWPNDLTFTIASIQNRAVVEQFGRPRQPIAAEQAAEIAGQCEAAHRDDNEICEQGHRTEQVKVICRERQRTETTQRAMDQTGQDNARDPRNTCFHFGITSGASKGINREQPVAEFFQRRHEQGNAQHDEKGELKAGLEELLRVLPRAGSRGQRRRGN